MRDRNLLLLLASSPLLAAAAESRPRGVSPECMFAHPNTSIHFTIVAPNQPQTDLSHSCEILQVERQLLLHPQPLRRFPIVQSQRRLLRLPRRLRRARHRRMLLPLPTLPILPSRRIGRRREHLFSITRLLLQKQGPSAKLPPLPRCERWRLRLRGMLRR